MARYAVVLYDFQGNEQQRTMTVLAGEVVKVEPREGRDWLPAEASDGRKGFIPKAYVKLQEQGWHPGNQLKPVIPNPEEEPNDLDSDSDDEDGGATTSGGAVAITSTNSSSKADTSSSSSSDLEGYVQAVAIYKFQKKEERQLSFNKKDVLYVKVSEEEKWWHAKLNGLSGLVPCNYIKVLKDGETPESATKKKSGGTLKSLRKKTLFDSTSKATTSSSTLARKDSKETNNNDSASANATAARLRGNSKESNNETSEFSSRDDRSDNSSNNNRNPNRNSKDLDQLRKQLQEQVVVEGGGSLTTDSTSNVVEVAKKNRNFSIRLRTAVAQLDFTGISETELSFKQGEFLDVEPKLNADWWPAVNSEGKTGLVPRNFVRIVEEHKKGESVAAQRRVTNVFSPLHEISAYERLTGNIGLHHATVFEEYSTLRDVTFFSVMFSGLFLPTNAYSLIPGRSNNNNNVLLLLPAPTLLEQSFPIIEAALRFVILEDGKKLLGDGVKFTQSNDMYLVIHGEIEVSVAGHSFNRMEAGCFIGESKLTSISIDPISSSSPNSKRGGANHDAASMDTTVIKSCGQSALLVLTKENFSTLITKLPWFKNAFDSVSFFRSYRYLSRLPLFISLDPSSLDLLGSMFHYRVLKRGESLFREGDDSREFFIVLSGEIGLSVTVSDGTRKVLQRVKAGGIFGEESLIGVSNVSDFDNNSSSSRNHHQGGGGGNGLRSTISKKGSKSNSSSNSSRNSGYVRMYAATVAESNTIVLTITGEQFATFITEVEPGLKAEHNRIVAMKSPETLKLVPFINDIVPQNKLDMLALAFEFNHFQDGEVIFRAGDDGDRFFIVCTGELEIVDSRGELVGPAKPGDFFGEIAMLENRPRLATVTCIQESICISLSTEGFKSFIQASPEIMTSLVQAISAKAQTENVRHRWIPTSPDELAGVAGPLFRKELFTNYEALISLDRWRSIGRDMAPCLKSLRGHPQYVHPFPFDIQRDPSKAFVITVIKLDEDLETMKISCRVSETVADVVQYVFERAGVTLDPAGPDAFGLKVAGRADYLVDRQAPLGRYKYITKQLRRGFDRGEMKFVLVDLRLHPRSGSCARIPVISQDKASVANLIRPRGESKLVTSISLDQRPRGVSRLVTSTLNTSTSAAGSHTSIDGKATRQNPSASTSSDGSVSLASDSHAVALEAVALYDYDSGELSFKAGDKLEIEYRADTNSWAAVVNGQAGFVPRNYVKALGALPESRRMANEVLRMRLNAQAGINDGGTIFGNTTTTTRSAGGSFSSSSPAAAAAPSNNKSIQHTMSNGSSTSSAGGVNLLGLPLFTLEEYAKTITSCSSSAEKTPPPWEPYDSARMFLSSDVTWPLRIRVREIQKLNRFATFDGHLSLIVKIELVYAGDVLETRFLKPTRKSFTLRFDDEWIYFDRLIDHVPFGARFCFTLLGLKNVNIESNLSSSLQVGLDGSPSSSSSSNPSLGGINGKSGSDHSHHNGISNNAVTSGFGSTAGVVSEARSVFTSSGTNMNFVLDPGGVIIPNGSDEVSLFGLVVGAERGPIHTFYSHILSGQSSEGSFFSRSKELAMRVTSSATKISGANRSVSGGDDTGKPIPLGGVSLPCWRIDLLLNSGKHKLNLWPGTEAEKHSYCISNPDFNTPEIFIEVDSFSRPVRYDMPPEVPVLGQDTTTTTTTTTNLDFSNGGNVGSTPNSSPDKAKPRPKISTGNSYRTLNASNNAKEHQQAAMTESQQKEERRKKLQARRVSVSAFKKAEWKVDKKVTQPVSKKVAELLARDPLMAYKMDPIERSLLWSERELLINDPFALSKLMLAVDWTNPQKRDAALALLARWSPPQPMQALELLGGRFGEYRLREYAVKCLEPFDDEELAEFLLQLTQVLKYEPAHDSPLARFLFKRALANPREIGTRLFWSLRAEMHLSKYSTRFGLILQAYLQCCESHIDELTQQHDVQELLKGVAERAQRQKFPTKEDRNEYAKTELTKLNSKLPAAFQFALDPRIKVKSFNVAGCKVMSSKKRPLWLSMNNYDPGEAGGESVLVMFKAGDDLRQDQMTLQLLRVMEQIWLAEGMNLRLTPYSCVATGDELGMLEIVPNSDTTASIQKKVGGRFGALQDTPLREWLQENNKGVMNVAVDNFVHSCAGYCVATYILGIGDRHSDNIMVTKQGHLFHIDFGHFLGNFKSKMGFKRERTAFVFTKEMAAVMGGKGGESYNQFVKLSCEAFNLLRRHGDELVSLFRLMIPAALPELRSDEDIQYLVDRLELNATEEEATKSFKNEINSALSDTYRRIDNFIHNIKT